MILFCCVAGYFFEWLFCRLRKEPVSEAVFVTAVLFALVMPPGAGWHVLTVGMAVAVIFSKEVFGGFGRNIFNPALAGRCFVYVCFPVALTGIWYPPAEGPLGALTLWSTSTTSDGTVAVTSATPMAHLKAGRLVHPPVLSSGIPHELSGVQDEIPFFLHGITFPLDLVFSANKHICKILLKSWFGTTTDFSEKDMLVFSKKSACGKLATP